MRGDIPNDGIPGDGWGVVVLAEARSAGSVLPLARPRGPCGPAVSCSLAARRHPAALAVATASWPDLPSTNQMPSRQLVLRVPRMTVA